MMFIVFAYQACPGSPDHPRLTTRVRPPSPCLSEKPNVSGFTPLR